MSRFAQLLLVSISMVEVRLRCCIVRLEDRADTEALHDLRIELRSLRSLLHPLRGLPAIELLEQAAADIGRLTNPLRELQVFCAELQALGMHDEVANRSKELQPAIRQLLNAPHLARLLELLEGFPAIWRLSAREGCLSGLRKRIKRRLKRAFRRMPSSLHQAPEDLHALRLLVKRLRYGCETYAALSPVNPRQLKLLRRLQQALGEWNDCQSWLSLTADNRLYEQCWPLWLARAEAAVVRAGLLLERFEQSRA